MTQACGQRGQAQEEAEKIVTAAEAAGTLKG